MRIRTINSAVEELKKEDSNSAITTHYVRKLCKENLIAYKKSGCKYLVDYDSLLEYIKGNTN